MKTNPKNADEHIRLTYERTQNRVTVYNEIYETWKLSEEEKETILKTLNSWKEIREKCHQVLFP